MNITIDFEATVGHPLRSARLNKELKCMEVDHIYEI